MEKATTNIVIILFLATLITGCQSTSQRTVEPIPLKPGYVFTDHMVLQQQHEVAFWGKYTEGEKVSVAGSWGKSATTSPNGKGNWELKLPTPQAGGPFEVVVTTKDSTITFKDVMIGEVWLSSGPVQYGVEIKAV